jgi:transcriptional regulator with XRE-family HTH domain
VASLRKPTTFGALLLRHLDAAGLSQNAFAKATHVHVQSLNAIIHGLRPPPADRVERWAEELRLTERRRREFVLEGALQRSPQIVRDEVERLRRLASSGRR